LARLAISKAFTDGHLARLVSWYGVNKKRGEIPAFLLSSFAGATCRKFDTHGSVDKKICKTVLKK
jgi:hypothetical protein